MSDRPDPTVPLGVAPPAVAPAADPDVSPREPRRPRVTPAVGALLVAVAVTSLLDDADLVSLRWWIPFAVAAVLAALAVVALTVRRLLAPGITLAAPVADGNPPPDAL